MTENLLPGGADPTSWCRYAFRSVEKAALQEIGPRFTLKLRWVKKRLPFVHTLGRPSRPLALLPKSESENPTDCNSTARGEAEDARALTEETPYLEDEYIWLWKVCPYSFLARVLQNDHR